VIQAFVVGMVAGIVLFCCALLAYSAWRLHR